MDGELTTPGGKVQIIQIVYNSVRHSLIVPEKHLLVEDENMFPRHAYS